MAKRKAASIDRAFELVSLGRASYASKSAIASLLAHIDAEGLPESYDRAAQYRARKEICRNRSGDYGPLVIDVQVPLEGGKNQTMSFQNAFAFLQHNCMHSPHYSQIMQAALQRHPCSPANPWRMILYQDGVDPSDGLGKNHSRKSAVIYWSFAELGMAALSREEVWGTICVARYSEYTKLAGKGGSLFEAVLNHLFGQHDFQRGGCSLTFPNGEHALLLAKPSILLADMPALKECLQCKGHSGTLCCPACANAVQQNTAADIPLHQLTDKAISIANTDLKAFTQHTDETIRHTVSKVNEYHEQWLNGDLTKDQFGELQQVLGWNYSPCDVVLNRRHNLYIASMLMYDWAHVYVHDGIGDHELGQCMKVFHSNKSMTSYSELGDYVGTFQFPKNAPALGHLFTKAANANNAKNGTFSCTGSEFLTLAPVLLRYFKKVVLPRGQFLDHVKSMIAALEVIIMLQAVKTGTVQPTALHKKIKEHLDLYKKCYGAVKMRPKHHYALHLPGQLALHGFLLATFTHERKHRLVTRYTRDRKNLRNWDAGSIEEITCHQLWELKQPFFKVCKLAKPRGSILIPLRELLPGVEPACMRILNDISCNGGTMCSGDVVSCIIDGKVQLGQLMVCVGVTSETTHKSYSVVSLWQPDPRCSDDEWRTFAVSRENVVMIALECMDTVFTYRMARDGQSCVVHLPFEVRPK